jgi:uracil-DNA glycosylase
MNVLKFTSMSEIESEVINCRNCPRLVTWREQVGIEKRKAYRDETYWSRPVPGFGDEQARVLVVGLAPGAHGSNRTGRMFTGDDSGKFLYPALWRAGFASQPQGSHPQDGLVLHDMWITAICRCVPPDNKPNRQEINQCKPWLEEEIKMLADLKVIVALGKIAWDEIATRYGFVTHEKIPPFSHGAVYFSENKKVWILASYHPSRQNTQTHRLTAPMFDEIWSKARQLLVG